MLIKTQIKNIKKTCVRVFNEVKAEGAGQFVTGNILAHPVIDLDNQKPMFITINMYVCDMYSLVLIYRNFSFY